MANTSKATALEFAGGSKTPQDQGAPVVHKVTDLNDPRDTTLRAMVTAANRPADNTNERYLAKVLTIQFVVGRERALKGAQQLYHAKVALVLQDVQS